MKSQVLANFDITWLPVTALIIFLVVFFGVLLLIFRKDSKKIYNQAESLPLENDGDMYVG